MANGMKTAFGPLNLGLDETACGNGEIARHWSTPGPEKQTSSSSLQRPEEPVAIASSWHEPYSAMNERAAITIPVAAPVTIC
jgi:hypothetical protein